MSEAGVVGQVWLVYGVKRSGGRREVLQAWTSEELAQARCEALEAAEEALDERTYSKFAVRRWRPQKRHSTSAPTASSTTSWSRSGTREARSRD